MKILINVLLLAALVVGPSSLRSKATPQTAPNIGTNPALSSGSVKRGRSVRGSVTMDIPSGYHVNSNRPLEKFLIPTELRVEAPKGFRVTPVSYPRSVSRNFKFSKNRVLVYEGRAIMRFTVTVPSNASTGSTELKLRLRFQSCNDEVCFPPATREMKLWVNVE